MLEVSHVFHYSKSSQAILIEDILHVLAQVSPNGGSDRTVVQTQEAKLWDLAGIHAERGFDVDFLSFSGDFLRFSCVSSVQPMQPSCRPMYPGIVDAQGSRALMRLVPWWGHHRKVAILESWK